MVSRQAFLGAVMAALVAAACQAVAETPTSGATVGAIATVTSPPWPSAVASVTPAASETAMAFASAVYGYRIALPAGWSVLKPASTPWDGTGAPGHDTAVTDLFASSAGTLAWANATRTTASLAEFTASETAAEAAEHPCPTTPEVDEPFEVAGEVARFTVKHCPATGGILVAMATVIVDGTGYVFHFQHPPSAPASEEDVAVFRDLLNRVSFRR